MCPHTPTKLAGLKKAFKLRRENKTKRISGFIEFADNLKTS